jgi:hypothetical protein
VLPYNAQSFVVEGSCYSLEFNACWMVHDRYMRCGLSRRLPVLASLGLDIHDGSKPVAKRQARQDRETPDGCRPTCQLLHPFTEVRLMLLLLLLEEVLLVDCLSSSLLHTRGSSIVLEVMILIFPLLTDTCGSIERPSPTSQWTLRVNSDRYSTVIVYYSKAWYRFQESFLLCSHFWFY